MTEADDWYYEQDGKSCGPVSRVQLVALLQDQTLPPSTRVWHEAFGQAWRPANETDLLPRRPRPPPLPPREVGTAIAPPAGSPPAIAASGEPVGAFASIGATHPALGDENAPTSPASGKAGTPSRQPPTVRAGPGLGPTPGGADSLAGSAEPLNEADLASIDGTAPTDVAEATSAAVTSAAKRKRVTAPRDGYANVMAFSPLLVLWIDLLLMSRNIDPFGTHVAARGFMMWTFVGTIILATLDARRIGQRGLNPDGRALVPFILLTHVGYFIRREAIVPGSMRLLWTWLACVAVYVATIMWILV